MIDNLRFDFQVSDDLGKKTITCQHGPNECYGNKIHACAIQNNTQNDYMNFIGCDMVDGHPQNDAIAEKVCTCKYFLISLASKSKHQLMI